MCIRDSYIPYADRPSLIDSLLEIVDLSDKKDAYVDSLSRGMKQRLCLARSLIHDPNLIILDEPASGLDPRARVEMKEVLKQLKEMGKTIIVSSHILPELAEMCSEIGIIDHGQLVTQGTVNEIMNKIHKNRIVRVKTCLLYTSRCVEETWLNALKAEICKLVVKIDSVAVVNLNVYLAVKAVGHNSLEKRVCVYKATYSVINV